MPVEIGQVIDGKYKLLRLIGQGGMGAVYEGTHQLIDRRVAIKVLLPTTDSNAAGRFEQEARAAGRIGSDHILEILDIGSLPDASKYMVCEYLDGEPLSARIHRKHQLASTELSPLIVQILTGLGAAHSAGIVHRDLKPDNIFVLNEKAGKRDFIKIIDFGISKFSQLDGGDGLSMTKTGMVVGTPNYMSPEQARGLGGVDHRSDLYAVGVMMYEALSGQLPFDAETFNDLLFKVVLETPTPLDTLVPDLDPELLRIVQKAMAREANDRYSSAGDFAADLTVWNKVNQLGTGTAAVQMTDSLLRRLRDSIPDDDGRTSPLPNRPSTGRGARISGTADTIESVPPPPGAPTPGAFGSTAQVAIPTTQPLWMQRNMQYGVVGILSIVLLGLVAVAFSGGKEEGAEPPLDPVAAARAAEDAQGPTQDQLESAAAAEEAEKASAQAERNAAEAERKAAEAEKLAAEAEKKAAAAEAKAAQEAAAARAIAPARPRATSPTPRPQPGPKSKSRYDFGY